jgi:hypothetical protein
MKDVKSETRPFSPGVPDEDLPPRERVSVSSTLSDHEEIDSPPMPWPKDTEESGFIVFLEQLNSIEFDLPMLSLLRSLMGMLISSGVDEPPEVVRHCLILFFTHINTQQ